METAIALLIVLHGLIHLIGFGKAFHLAEITRLAKPITKPMGTAWLAACLFLVTGGIAYFMKIPLCWTAIGAGIVISQLLIIAYWQDAKAGTMVNILLLPVLVTSFGVWDFEKKTGKAVEKLLGHHAAQQLVDDPSTSPLPSLVQFWLHQTGATGKPKQYHVMVKQEGEMKTSPDGTWNPFSATHWTNFDKPGFVWHATMKTGPGLHVAVFDKFVDGRGSMAAKIQSLIALKEATGPEIDEGAMQRYLAEMVWAPSFALSPHIQWEQMDNVRVKATMKYEGKEAAVIFTLNATGLIKKCEAIRIYYEKNASLKVPWIVDMDELSYKSFDGILVPAKYTITWKLEGGDYIWFKMEIKERKVIL